MIAVRMKAATTPPPWLQIIVNNNNIIIIILTTTSPRTLWIRMGTQGNTTCNTQSVRHPPHNPPENTHNSKMKTAQYLLTMRVLLLLVIIIGALIRHLLYPPKRSNWHPCPRSNHLRLRCCKFVSPREALKNVKQNQHITTYITFIRA